MNCISETTPDENGGKTTKTTTTTTKPPVTTEPPAYTGGKLAWPAPGFYYISSPFGSRWGRNHNGIDIAGGGIQGASATAAASGTVTKIYTGCSHNYKGFCGCNYGWGNYVMVSHGNGLVTLYAHLQAVSVSVGDSVGTGTVVGKIGCTGNSTGFHLHFGVISNGSYVNPLNYLN
ncbi:MAG: M23 family metallopeptidase [Oscillospiraceae bacterium]|nr:M23 family metallopeptidase [Oscillospiraceae bacterium]